MSDVALVALFSSSATVLVAIAGVIGSIWGAAWREERQRRAEQQRETETLRYTRAMELVAAIAARDVGDSTMKNVWAVTQARARFVATLRPGEGAAQKFTQRMIDSVTKDVGYARPKDRPRMFEVYSDRLFSWLRGDISTQDLAAPEADWPVSEQFHASGSFEALKEQSS